MAPHVSHHRVDTKTQFCVPVPDGVSSRHAAFTRLAMVSMATLRTTTARLGDRVGVIGLGLVGNLAAQLAGIAGMSTLAIDLIPWRCDLARECGIDGVVCSPGDDVLTRDYQLVIEATGTVGGAQTGMRLVRRNGELSLVGSQWGEGSQTGDTLRFLGTIFEEYVHIRSGWEWQIPVLDTPFGPASASHSARSILDWIARDRLVLDPLLSLEADPREAQGTYESIVSRKDEILGVIFDWSNIADEYPRTTQ
jgi:threonine dehydrogenase-like Zn-dependent dehydrogenase